MVVLSSLPSASADSDNDDCCAQLNSNLEDLEWYLRGGFEALLHSTSSNSTSAASTSGALEFLSEYFYGLCEGTHLGPVYPSASASGFRD